GVDWQTPSWAWPEDGGGFSLSPGERTGVTAIELSPAAGPHWQALNLNPNRSLARFRFLEIKSKITIKIGKKPFRLNSMAVRTGVRGKKVWPHPTVPVVTVAFHLPRLVSCSFSLFTGILSPCP